MYGGTSRENIEVFIAHPGGPFWKNRDKHAWSLPKGLVEHKEDKLEAAKREFDSDSMAKKIPPHYP